MIDYIKGHITSLNPAEAILEIKSGLGFAISIILPDYSRLESSMGTGEEVCLLIHECIREDAWTLYGFVESAGRDIFRKLIGVSGVGASTARMIMSALGTSELATAIASGDSKKLKAVKGVGAKTAERIIVDLHDKIKPDDLSLSIDNPISPATNENFDEALAALTMLGFGAPQSRKVLKKLFGETPDIKVETAIRKALPLL